VPVLSVVRAMLVVGIRTERGVLGPRLQPSRGQQLSLLQGAARASGRNHRRIR
jgi:hypothetical protein